MAGMEGHDHLCKVLLVGDAGVGKSSILLRFTDDTFDDHLQSTIGVDFKLKMMRLRGKRIKLTIWDTAGQERFRTLTSSYYRGAHGIMFVYDTSRRDTFQHLNQWLQEVEMYCPGRNAVKLLVGNKIDLADRVVSKAEAEAWARANGMLFLESSAKTKIGINQVFEEVAEKILDNPTLLESTVPAAKRGVAVSKDLQEGGGEGAAGCCG